MDSIFRPIVQTYRIAGVLHLSETQPAFRWNPTLDDRWPLSDNHYGHYGLLFPESKDSLASFVLNWRKLNFAVMNCENCENFPTFYFRYMLKVSVALTRYRRHPKSDDAIGFFRLHNRVPLVVSLVGST